MLEGKNVNLRVMEKEDISLFSEWASDPEFLGEFISPVQNSTTQIEKALLEPGPHELKRFMIEKKDGTKIGFVGHFCVLHPAGKQKEIGYLLLPSERGKGYCTEAVKIMIDYLFLSDNIRRIQAQTDLRNKASQKVLEKVGFKKEGTLPKNFFTMGEWRDTYVFSILREEWKAPKILTKN